jgi:glycosyltransferase involved in cell wall biosynthesis
MRVVIVLAASVGGIGTYVRDLAERCIECGDHVVVAGPAATEEHFGFTSVGARFAPVAVDGPAALLKLRRVLTQADVVHSQGIKAAAMTNLARVGRRGPRHVVTLHNAILAVGLRAGISAVVERLAVRPSDVVLGASADLVQRAKELGARQVDLGVVPAPLPAASTRSRAEVRAELGIAGGDEALALAVGRLAPQKSLPLLLDAVAEVANVAEVADVAEFDKVAELATAGSQGPKTSLHLVIAGDGPEREQLAARIAAEQLPVTLLGHRTDIADLLAAADVFVLSSRWEARALVVQEALRAGVPVVATAVGGLPDLVGDAALLVPWNDAAALADALARVLTNSALSDRLRETGPIQAATWPTAAAALDSARRWYSA